MPFTIDSDYTITAHADAVPAREDQITFETVNEFGDRTANWPLQNLTNLWNAFAGVPPFGDLKPVKKFENRRKGTRRIWEAIQKLASDPAPAAPKLPAKAATKATVRAQRATTRTPKAAEANTTRTPSEGSRKELVLDLIRRKTGASLAEIMEATGWQAHSVRGFIATLHTKHGIQINSSKDSAGERVYRVQVAR